MKKVIYLIFCAFLSAHCVNAQNVMRIHFNNNTSQDFDVNTIDSVCWIIPDVPDDGGQEVQYTTIYFGQTTDPYIIELPANDPEGTIQSDYGNRFTYLDPTSFTYNTSTTGVEVRAIQVSGNSYTLEIDNEIHPSSFIAMPIDWEVKSWTEKAFGGTVMEHIRTINRGTYKIVYYSDILLGNVNNHIVVVGKK